MNSVGRDSFYGFEQNERASVPTDCIMCGPSVNRIAASTDWPSVPKIVHLDPNPKAYKPKSEF